MTWNGFDLRGTLAGISRMEGQMVTCLPEQKFKTFKERLEGKRETLKKELSSVETALDALARYVGIEEVIKQMGQ